jgi:hypothetical protein
MHEENVNLHWSVGSDLLRSLLTRLMDLPELEPFRLVGGTSLSLQLGHRISNDLDLFTDNQEGIDLRKIDTLLRENFDYVDMGTTDNFLIGIMRFIGDSPDNCIKLDLFFTDKFIHPPLVLEGIRLATIEDIAAMKLEMISLSGRKKDFWDMAEILDHFDFARLLNVYKEKYPYSDIETVLGGLTNFILADQQEDPICLRGRFWELIKLDMEETVKEYLSK